MPVSKYPKAEWKGDGQSGGSYTSGPWKVVLHTTETAGIPGYDGGASAPHLTYYAAKRQWVQHSSLTSFAARALRNEPGGVQTNRDSALQVEIVAYAQESMVDKYGGGRIKVSELTPENLADLREFLIWTRDNFGVEMKWPGKVAKSYSEASAKGFRMSNAEWDEYDGICGHQHVPENTHWDPGGLDWESLMKEEDIMTPAQEAKLDAVLQGLTLIPAKTRDATWSQQVYDYTDEDGNPVNISAALALSRTNRNVRSLFSVIRAETDLSDEEIAEIANGLREDLGDEIAKALGQKLIA